MLHPNPGPHFDSHWSNWLKVSLFCFLYFFNVAKENSSHFTRLDPDHSFQSFLGHRYGKLCPSKHCVRGRVYKNDKIRLSGPSLIKVNNMRRDSVHHSGLSAVWHCSCHRNAKMFIHLKQHSGSDFKSGSHSHSCDMSTCAPLHTFALAHIYDTGLDSIMQC